MGLAFWMASFSKDPDTQVGAVVISDNNEPLGWGYNGPPREISDFQVNWDRPYKYDFMRHAEINAITFCGGRNLKGATLYVTAPPCKKCMLDIAASQIRKIIYFPYQSKDGNSMLHKYEDLVIAEEIAKLASITLSEFKGNLNWMRDRIEWMANLGIFDLP